MPTDIALLVGLRGCLDRGQCRGDAGSGELAAIRDLRLSIIAEARFEHLDCARWELPRLRQLRAAVDGAERVAPTRSGRRDDEREFATAIGDDDLGPCLPRSLGQ